jgi:hypothetical protein
METSGLAAVYMGQDTSGSYVALRAETAYNNTRYNAAVSLEIDPTTANNNAIFRSKRDNTIDLGSSSYQFKNTYTKNLYVDGNQVDPTMFPFTLRFSKSYLGGVFPYCKLGFDEYVGKGFNDLTETGIYQVRTDSSIQDSPVTGTIDGILVVYNSNSSANVTNNRRCRQIFYTNNSNARIFIRLCSVSKSSSVEDWVWSSWEEIPTNNRSYQWNSSQYFLGSYLGNEYTSNYYTNFGIYGKRDTYGQSGMFITKYRPAVNQGEMTTSDAVQFGIDALENSVRTHNVFDIKAKGFDSETGKFTVCDVVTTLEGNLGTADNPWKTFNGLNPGALSLPNIGAETDFSGDVIPPTGESGINISGGLNTFTPEFDGWISIRYNHATVISVVRGVACSFGNVLSLPSAGEITLSMPVIANVTYQIRIIATETNKYTHFYFTKSKGDPTNP